MQLRSLQQNLLDGSVITSDGNTGGEEGQEGRSRIVALEKELAAAKKHEQSKQIVPRTYMFSKMFVFV